MTVAEQIGALRRTLNRSLSRRVAKRTKRPLMQLSALRAVSRGEVNTQAELADRLLIDAPAASRLVAKLEAEGLLEQCAGKDRRCVRLKSTVRAKKEVVALDAELAVLNAEIRGAFTAQEFAKFSVLLKKLVDRLSVGATAA